MATIILGIVGAGVGALVAGPGGAAKGAMLGWSIGTTVGSYIDQARMHYYTADMGRTTDLRVTVASYGTSIPLCWGLTRIPGVIVWGTDLQEHEQDINSGGGGVTGHQTVTTRSYTYSVSFAMVICKGPGASGVVNKLDRIFADDLVVFDNVTTPGTPTGGTLGAITHAPIYDSFSAQVGDSYSYPDGSVLRFYYGTETQNADPTIIAAAGNIDVPSGSDNPAMRGTCYLVWENFWVTNYGDRLPNFSIRLNSGATTFANVMTDVLTDVGVQNAQMDTTAVANIPITGMCIASRIDAKSAVQPLIDAYHVDLVDVDGVIRAVPRGLAPVGTIPWDDMGAQTVGSGSAPSTQRVIKTRTDDLSLPKALDVGYLSPSIDLQQATQRAVRQSTRNDNSTSVSYPLTLTDVEAIQLANRLLYIAWIERTTYRADLMPWWISLCGADCVMLQYDAAGNTHRVRVVSAEAGLNGEIKCQFITDDDFAYNQGNIAVTSNPTGGNPVGSPVASTWFAWSGVELRDQDTIHPGFYIAATGAAGWTGGTIFVSVDGGATYNPAGSIASRGIWGTVSAALGNTYTPNGNGFDATESVNVTINGILSSTSETSVLNGGGNYGLILKNNTAVSNATDYEILGFANTSLVSAGVYTISDLLRAQRSTPSSGHASSDMFVALNSAVQRVTVSSSMIGQIVKVKVVSAGFDPTAVTAQDVFIATPTNLYATTGGVAAGRTPYFRARGYIGGTKTGSIDDTYFLDGSGTPGANHPGGVNDQYWEEASLSPIDISWRYETPGTGYTMYLRINIVNSTASPITFNWWAAGWDNLLKVRLAGSVIYNNGAFDTNGTATVPANITQLLEIFFFNNPSVAWNPSDQGEAWFKTDAIKSGLSWSDAGK